MTRLLTAQEVSEMLRVPPSWLYTQARAGRFPHVRAGRYVRFDERDVARWIDEQRNGNANGGPHD